MAQSLQLLVVLLVCLVHDAVSFPQTNIQLQYPNGAFDDPVPNNDHNQKFHDYASVLTRFDPWVTGQKVPIPADPVTDALHQDLPPEAASLGSTRHVRTPVEFADSVPQGSEAIPAYNEYIRVLTRFDPSVTGQRQQAAHEHAVFKRENEERAADSLISKDKDFGEQIEDKVPELSTETADPVYGDFVKELKRFDPWLVGHNVSIPRNASADEQWISESKE
ncbi:uncharacterized protein LOC131216548 [Anopheles bellator]|uniref:uncharacterized protein LOC131216548 n=1 Tax=Anopheles bellator TaxID=139047 RepID=UPI002647B6DA|nr:uncharacterized protein LOC131216548 [Anopheles bellator]